MESLEESPDKQRSSITIVMRISPFLEKVNPKRKHIEEMESDKDIFEEMKTKKVRRNLGEVNRMED